MSAATISPVPRADFAWCVPIATQTLHAAGAAMAFKVRKEPRCALAYIGDGGTSEGAFYEALNLAGARALPVVFVIVNNGWAISVPVAAQTAAANPGAESRGRRHSRACRWTATTCSPCATWLSEALEAARARRRPDADRGAHLPPERSHDRRRRQPLSRPARRSRRHGRSNPCFDCGSISVECRRLGRRRRSGPCCEDCARASRCGGERILGRAPSPRPMPCSSILFAELPRAPARAARARARKYGAKPSGH